MTIRATFNEAGFVTGFYPEDVWSEGYPETAKEITLGQYEELLTHQGFRIYVNGEVVEYTPPTPDPLPPDQLRALMPPLSRRQFWLGANSLGMSKADVLAATDDPIIIIEIEETTEFHRTYESVVMLSEVLGITPDQLDDVWMWWASA